MDLIELTYYIEKIILNKFNNLDSCKVFTTIKGGLGSELLEISTKPEQNMYYDLTKNEIIYWAKTTESHGYINSSEIETFIRKHKIKNLLN